MGTYYNPPNNLPRVARPLTFNARLGYADLVLQLKPGEKLFGLYDRGPFMNAVYMPDESEFDAFEAQVDSGWIDRCGFYAMSAEKFHQEFNWMNTH